MIQILIYLWGLENFILTFISYGKIRSRGEHLGFIYPFVFINGTFVWEDMIVFGALHTTSVVIGLAAGDLRLTILFFLLFWVVRSSGETLYFFLQQFLRPKHHPHFISEHFKPLRNIFGAISDQKCFIILQVIHQSICVLSLFAAILLLLHWNSIGVIPAYR